MYARQFFVWFSILLIQLCLCCTSQPACLLLSTSLLRGIQVLGLQPWEFQRDQELEVQGTLEFLPPECFLSARNADRSEMKVTRQIHKNAPSFTLNPHNADPSAPLCFGVSQECGGLAVESFKL